MTNLCEKLKDIHEMHAETVNYKERFNKFPLSLYAKKFIAKVINFLRPNGNEKILDVGCGDGLYLDVLIKNGSKSYGLDLSGKRLSRCNKKAFRIKADAQNLPFRSDIFDKILIVETMEHLPSPDEAISEIYRVLKEGGTVIISVPDIIMNLCLKIASKLPFSIFESCKYSVVEHLWRLNDKKLKILLSENGFKVIRSEHFISHIFPINNIVSATKEMLRKELLKP